MALPERQQNPEIEITPFVPEQLEVSEAGLASYIEIDITTLPTEKQELVAEVDQIDPRFAPYMKIKQEEGQTFIVCDAGMRRAEEADKPAFPNFSADAIIATILAKEPFLLKEQLRYSAFHQAKEYKAYNAAEPGKIHHEYPPAERPPAILENEEDIQTETSENMVSTEFVSSYATAMFIIGHDMYERMTGDEAFIEEQRESLEAAVEYTLEHVQHGVFLEDPNFSGAEHFALRGTNWNDSGDQPTYPTADTIVQVQYIAALRGAARLLQRPELAAKAQQMVENLPLFFDEEFDTFYLRLDAKGPKQGLTVDPLLMLYYLEPGDLPDNMIEKIVKSSRELETDAGYLTYDRAFPRPKPDHPDFLFYYKPMIAPFVQAQAHIGARKFGVEEIMENTERVVGYLQSHENDPEILIEEPDLDNQIVEAGMEQQLWTLGARKYFENPAAYDFLMYDASEDVEDTRIYAD